MNSIGLRMNGMREAALLWKDSSKEIVSAC